MPASSITDMGNSKIWYQRLLTLFLIAYFVLGYIPINHFNVARGVFHTLGLPGENKIPFMIPFILGYCLVYGSFLIIYFAAPNWETFKKAAWGYFWVTTIHYIIFVLYPVKMIWRPEIVNPNTFFEYITWFFFWVDKPYNCFPSLHVAYPTFAAVFSYRFVPRVLLVNVALAFLTAFSVVVIKQHYILDAVGGAAIATLIGVLIPRKTVFS